MRWVYVFQEEEKQKRLALEERDRNYQTLMSVLMREPLIANQEEVECPICFDTIPIGEGVVLRECLHSFCRYVTEVICPEVLVSVPC